MNNFILHEAKRYQSSNPAITELKNNLFYRCLMDYLQNVKGIYDSELQEVIAVFTARIDDSLPVDQVSVWHLPIARLETCSSLAHVRGESLSDMILETCPMPCTVYYKDTKECQELLATVARHFLVDETAYLVESLEVASERFYNNPPTVKIEEPAKPYHSFANKDFNKEMYERIRATNYLSDKHAYQFGNARMMRVFLQTGHDIYVPDRKQYYHADAIGLIWCYNDIPVPREGESWEDVIACSEDYRCFGSEEFERLYHPDNDLFYEAEEVLHEIELDCQEPDCYERE